LSAGVSNADWQVLGDQTVDAALPRNERIELSLIARGLVEASLRLEFPVEADKTSIEVWLCPESGPPMQFTVKGPQLASPSLKPVRLPLGVYDVIAHSSVFGEDNSKKPSLQYRGRVDVVGGVEIPVRLGPGATLEGVALDRDKRPIADDVVFLRLNDLQKSTYRAMTDEHGSFRFVGLVPMEQYSYNSGESLWIGPPGVVSNSTVQEPNELP
jgi:hypothetical protein